MTYNERVNKLLSVCGFLVLVGIFFFFGYTDFVKVPEYTYTYVGKGARDITGEISEGIVVTQEIPYYLGDDGLSFQFSTYGHRVIGEVSVQAVGKTSGIVYFDQTLSGKVFRNNEFVDFLFSGDLPDESETIVVTFSSNSRPDSSLTLLTTHTDSIPNHKLTVNGVEFQTDLMVRRVVSHKAYNFALIIVGSMLVVGVIILLVICKCNWRLENVYLVTALLLGIIYMFVMTPLSIPDEQVHYYSAYKLSNLFCFKWNDMDYGNANNFNFYGFKGHSNVRSGYERIMNDLFEKSNTPVRWDIGGFRSSYPVMYMPQALGIAVGRLLNLNFLMTFYFGRLCNLLFFIFCVYFSIREAPRLKMLFFMLGIMPMVLHQAASYSYDAFTNGMVFLLIALILKLADGEGQVRIRELIPLIIVSVFMCPTKVVYAPILLLLFIIPVSRIGSGKKYLLFICSVIGLSIFLVWYNQFSRISSLVSSNERISWNGGINYTFSYIISHPKHAVLIFSNTFRQSSLYWLQTGIGRVFSGLTLVISEWNSIVYMALLMIASFDYDGQKRIFDAKDCIILMISSIVVVLGIMLSMFVGWTPAGNEVITGVQGRYFIPVIPLLFMCINNSSIRITKSNKVSIRILVFIAMSVNFSALWQVLIYTMKN